MNNDLSYSQKKNIKKVIDIWKVQGHDLSKEDENMLKNVVLSKSADSQIKNILKNEERKWF